MTNDERAALIEKAAALFIYLARLNSEDPGSVPVPLPAVNMRASWFSGLSRPAKLLWLDIVHLHSVFTPHNKGLMLGYSGQVRVPKFPVDVPDLLVREKLEARGTLREIILLLHIDHNLVDEAFPSVTPIDDPEPA